MVPGEAAGAAAGTGLQTQVGPGSALSTATRRSLRGACCENERACFRSVGPLQKLPGLHPARRPARDPRESSAALPRSAAASCNSQGPGAAQQDAQGCAHDRAAAVPVDCEPAAALQPPNPTAGYVSGTGGFQGQLHLNRERRRVPRVGKLERAGLESKTFRMPGGQLRCSPGSSRAACKCWTSFRARLLVCNRQAVNF